MCDKTTVEHSVLCFMVSAMTMLFFGHQAEAKYSGGTGEPNAPYQIATAADLIALGEDPNDYDKHFVLTSDIDLNPNLPGRRIFDKAVIAPDTEPAQYNLNGPAFTGVFDGNGHKIFESDYQGRRMVGLVW